MRYLLTFYGPEGEWDDASPEEVQAGIAAWNAFDAETQKADAYIACKGLQPSATATTIEFAPNDERLLTDGPFIETKEQLGGFSLLECANLDEALDWARRVPLGEGWKVEVRPVMDYGQPAAEASAVAGEPATP